MALRKLPLLGFLTLAVAVSGSSFVLHEKRAIVPKGFTTHGVASPDEEITLRLGLAPNDIVGLQTKLASISTPGSSEFRQWLSAEEVKSYVQPSDDTVSAFNTFASANNLKTSIISPNGDWAAITLPVSKANSLFAANFQSFSHPELSERITRTLSVSLPAALVGHVEAVHPTTEFTIPPPRPSRPHGSIPKAKAGKSQVSADCDATHPGVLITPACLQEFYGIPKTPARSPNNTLLVTAYFEEWAQEADLKAFLTALRPDINPNTTFSLLSIDDGINPQSPDPDDAGIEANLDIQYTIGIATGVPIDFLSVGSDGFSIGLLDTISFLDNVTNPPSVVTTSYLNDEVNVGSSLATRICNGYMARGGISVIFSSGDGGPRGTHDSLDVCGDNVFNPTFPASCPYVTTVGGTVGILPHEIALNLTGGGFSNVFPTPDYQKKQTAAFIAGIPSDFAGTFNRTGRGYPDVALQALHYHIWNGGADRGVSGTSASAPTFAAIIALINDVLVGAGKPVLGFLNPWLYANEHAFRDITVGHNSGFTCPASTVAFDAAEGWDATTGLGTPVYDALLFAALGAH
ncbi:family S53 protease-like protein [Mycena amicta]|nr:family S53 protease-like protein [Mycena amicta]